ncbi:hypothetical protein BGZ83_011876 [Gryganskiella cystojenkinii]|nr:hypothetical protein BGZ83_011876 [Gryganskiella cystojenkinii]
MQAARVTQEAYELFVGAGVGLRRDFADLHALFTRTNKVAMKKSQLSSKDSPIPQTLQSPLFLVDTLLCIGHFLDQPSLARSLRVCRSWHQLFLPCLWSTVEVRQLFTGHPNIYFAKPDCAQLKQHRSLIRCLDIRVNLDLVEVFGTPTKKGLSERLSTMTRQASKNLYYRALINLDIWSDEKRPKQYLVPPSPLFLPNLTSLTIHYSSSWDQDERATIRAMIQRHQSILKTLVCEWDIWDSLLDVIGGCKRLEELRIGALGMTVVKQWLDFQLSSSSSSSPPSPSPSPLWLCQLRVLAILPYISQSSRDKRKLSGYVDKMMPRLQALKKTTATTKIQDLSLHDCGITNDVLKVQQCLILKSPLLVRLYWGSTPSTRFTSEREPLVKHLIEIIQVQGPDFFRHLKSLELPGAAFENEDLKALLASMPLLRKLNLQLTQFDLCSWRALQEESSLLSPSFLSRLQSLNLTLCSKVTGAMVQEMLCSMENLVVFKAPYIASIDLLRDPRPWVCLKLRELYLGVIIWRPQEKDARQDEALAILNQLGQLVELDVLDLRTVPVKTSMLRKRLGEPIEQLLSLTLAGGRLDRLAGLKRLTRLYGPSVLTAVWKVPEARWLFEHWPRLETFQGIFVNREAFLLLQPRFPEQLFSCNIITEVKEC